LDLENSQLSSIPAEIGFLTNLVVLNVRFANLVSMPRSICALENFNGLNIIKDATVTCAIPTQKDALISIYSANPGNSLDWGVDNFPGVGFNTNDIAVNIDVANKNLSRLPTIIGALTSLEIILATNNDISEVPTSLGLIDALLVLEFGNNNLNTVPSELGQLSNLQLLTLTDNPITSIPQEVCDLQISNGGNLTILTDSGEGCL
jgi:Leucine-rich repeat (LRR) protein